MIVHVITGLAHGGAETALFRLLAATVGSERSHVVSLVDDGVYGSRLRALGIPVTSLRMRPGWPSPVAMLQLIRLLRTLRPDVVQAWMYHANLMAGIAARVLSIPVCWGIRHSNLDPELNKASTLRIAKLGARLSTQLPSRIISCSHRAAANHIAFGYAERFVIVPNGLDIKAFSPSKEARVRARSALGIHGSEIVLGHVGRFDVQKDHPTLLQACSNLRARNQHFRLLLCGKNIDSSNRELTTLIQRNGLEDVTTTLGARTDMPDLMRAMDLLVLSSRGEAFPNVVAEAMASGVPCVVTDVGDSAEIVGDTGWVVAPADPAALASALGSAMGESASKREARGAAARRRIEERYDISRMVAGYRRVWAGVTGAQAASCAE